MKRRFLDRVVLPDWWEDSLALTPGGFREAAAMVCSRLGFGLASLLEPARSPEFTDTGVVKHKKAAGVTHKDVQLATQYALGVARSVAAGLVGVEAARRVPDPIEWRERLLAESQGQCVTLNDIVRASWGLGIPVVHLRQVPPGVRKPDALATSIGIRPVIVVTNQRKSPSWLAFIVAHELGHLHCGHVKPGQTLVDEVLSNPADEQDEQEANTFALRLLTGQSDLSLGSTQSLGPAQLAEAATSFGRRYRIAPGVAALNYGFTTRRWAIANGAVARLEGDVDAGEIMRDALRRWLESVDLNEDAREWLRRTTGCGG